MHRKLRLYQSKLELNEIHWVKVEEKLNEVDRVFQILGITLDDLKQAGKQGIFKSNECNTKTFEPSSATLISLKDSPAKTQNPKSKHSGSSLGRKNTSKRRGKPKSKGTSLAVYSNKDSQLLRLHSDGEFVERSLSDDKYSILSIVTKHEEYKVKIEAISSPRRNSLNARKVKGRQLITLAYSQIFI